MTIYTLIRRVQRVVGRGVKGGRILLGPYNLKRELPILLIGITLAASIALAGFPLGGLWGLIIACPTAFAVAVATMILVAWRRSTPNWPPQQIRTRSRINQFRRRPVYVSGRGQLPPASVMAGGKVQVHR